MRWLAPCLVLLWATASLAESPALPMPVGDGPGTVATTDEAIPGEFVLKQKYLANQLFRDEFHGWSMFMDEGAWKHGGRGRRGPSRAALRALTGSSNPEMDFMALVEAGWLDEQQIAKGIEVKRRHDRLLTYARSRLVAAQETGDQVAVRAARVAIADMDRGHYMEKKTLMAEVRAVLARRRPDLMEMEKRLRMAEGRKATGQGRTDKHCTGPSCADAVVGDGPEAPSPALMRPPPMGGP